MDIAVSFDSVSFVRDGINILNDLNFQIKKGDSVAILGANGSGKTTLINLLFGYEWPSSGFVSLWGERLGDSPIFTLQKRIGILQSSHQSKLTQKNLTVSEMIITGLHQTLGLYKIPTDEEIKKSLWLLEPIGLKEKAENPFHTLSSGEKTKVLLARSLGFGKDLLVLDEPTENLDFKGRSDFYSDLFHWKTTNPELTRILVTHRIEEIPNDFTTVLLLKAGKILKFGSKKECLTDELLSELFSLEIEVVESSGQYFIAKKNQRV